MVKVLNQALTFCITIVGNSIVRAISGQHPAFNVISFQRFPFKSHPHIFSILLSRIRRPIKQLFERVQPPAHRMTELISLKSFP